MSTTDAVDVIQSDDYLIKFNDSIELQCLLQAYLDVTENSGCPYVFDSILCWQKTPAATWAFQSCAGVKLHGINYDSSQNATRYCDINGKWDNYTNYDACEHINHITHKPFEPHIEIATFIYFAGYILSLISLILAVILFIRLKDIRCLRNKIHLNLFSTYILTALIWILTLVIQLFVRPEGSTCVFLVIFLHYFSLTNFFWIMVEGLYLYMLVVQTFSGDNLRLNLYVKIGWGGPAIFVICWIIVKAIELPKQHVSHEVRRGTDLECAWLEESLIDWIVHAPAFLAVIINLVFLIRIMWVLITKLRSANSVETRQYRKATKALFVLIPLLGITYLLILIGPGEGVGGFIYAVLCAILVSTQGFLVALFYCFLNSEVRQAIRHRFNVWRDERNIRYGKTSQNRRYTVSKDYIRSRTESLRLTSSSPPI